MKKTDFQRIFKACFSDSARWQEWFFANVASDEADMMLRYDANGRAASALLMQPYDFLYEGSVLPARYISCVGTMPEARSKGLASAVMKDALDRAVAEGTALLTLIPAQDHLYFFYDRLGYATVFYRDRERYTSVHPFAGGRGELVEPSYELFHKLEMELGCGILHSREDYDNILADMAIDGNDAVIAVSDGEGGSAMLFAVADSAQITVKSMLATHRELGLTALAELRRRLGEKPVVVQTPPLSGEPAFLRPAGMMLITNAYALLSAMAAAHPDLKFSVRLTDAAVPANNGVYILAGGRCEKQPLRAGKFDLDVTAPTLAAILFNNHRTGNIFGIPSRRPYMALMLDS